MVTTAALLRLSLVAGTCAYSYCTTPTPKSRANTADTEAIVSVNNGTTSEQHQLPRIPYFILYVTFAWRRLNDANEHTCKPWNYTHFFQRWFYVLQQTSRCLICCCWMLCCCGALSTRITLSALLLPRIRSLWHGLPTSFITMCHNRLRVFNARRFRRASTAKRQEERR